MPNPFPRLPKSDRGHRVDGRPVALLIGSGEMPAQCAEMLTQQEFDIAGIHSPDLPLRAWAEAHDVQYFADFHQFRDWSETTAHDYLFSILNFKILPASMLEAPILCAINYHDAPLPKYAGSHACAWALHNRETTHGISWHVMTSDVDAGDIVRQVTFPISDGETLERLNQKCYLAAMRAFRAMLPDLKAETFACTPQDLSQRTFYARAQYPAR